MKREYTFQSGEALKTVVINRDDGAVTATIDGRDYRVTLPQEKLGSHFFTVDGQAVRAAVVKNGEQWLVNIGGQQLTLRRPERSRRRQGTVDGPAGDGSGVLTATMPGQVIEVLVEAGQEVARGQALVLLEAMKMELRVTAPFDAVVQKVHGAAGQTVDRGQALVELVAAEKED